MMSQLEYIPLKKLLFKTAALEATTKELSYHSVFFKIKEDMIIRKIHSVHAQCPFFSNILSSYHWEPKGYC